MSANGGCLCLYLHWLALLPAYSAQAAASRLFKTAARDLKTAMPSVRRIQPHINLQAFASSAGLVTLHEMRRGRGGYALITPGQPICFRCAPLFHACASISGFYLPFNNAPCYAGSATYAAFTLLAVYFSLGRLFAGSRFAGWFIATAACAGWCLTRTPTVPRAGGK